ALSRVAESNRIAASGASTNPNLPRIRRRSLHEASWLQLWLRPRAKFRDGIVARELSLRPRKWDAPRHWRCLEAAWRTETGASRLPSAQASPLAQSRRTRDSDIDCQPWETTSRINTLDDGYRRGRYKSVLVPKNTSADCITVSDSVGCGWIVSATSFARAAISIASVPSAINSPAPAPTMPTPSTRSLAGSRMSLVMPSVRSRVRARPEAAQGNFATLISRFSFSA